MNYKLKKISGDASFREFYRLQKGKNTSIIVQANKEKFKNLITYIVVNKILAKYKIYAPKLISNHYEQNIIEITDLGQKSFYNLIIKKKIKITDGRSNGCLLGGRAGECSLQNFIFIIMNREFYFLVFIENLSYGAWYQRRS